MKSYKQWLTEDFATGFKQSGDYHEVYINPSKSEIKTFNGNMRLILDSKEKSLYVSSGDVLHDDSIKALKVDGFLQGFNYNSYWKEGKDIDRYLTFVIEDGDYYTDSITDLFFNDRGNKEQNQINIKKLLGEDFSWLGKFMWFDRDKFNGMLDDIADAAKVKA